MSPPEALERLRSEIAWRDRTAARAYALGFTFARGFYTDLAELRAILRMVTR